MLYATPLKEFMVVRHQFAHLIPIIPIMLVPNILSLLLSVRALVLVSFSVKQGDKQH